MRGWRQAADPLQRDALAGAPHSKTERGRDEIDRRAKRDVGQYSRERERTESWIGELHVGVVPAPQLGDHGGEWRVVEHEAAIEPREKCVDGDAVREARGAVDSEATDIARTEAADAAHGDRSAADHDLHGPILSIAPHCKVGPNVARNRRPRVNDERAALVVLHLEVSLTFEVHGAFLFAVVGSDTYMTRWCETNACSIGEPELGALSIGGGEGLWRRRWRWRCAAMRYTKHSGDHEARGQSRVHDSPPAWATAPRRKEREEMTGIRSRDATDSRGGARSGKVIIVGLVQTVSQPQPGFPGVRRYGTRPLSFEIRQKRG